MKSLDEGQTHCACGYQGCAHWHCHWCAFENICRVERLQAEVARLREALNRLRLSFCVDSSIHPSRSKPYLDKIEEALKG